MMVSSSYFVILGLVALLGYAALFAPLWKEKRAYYWQGVGGMIWVGVALGGYMHWGAPEGVKERYALLGLEKELKKSELLPLNERFSSLKNMERRWGYSKEALFQIGRYYQSLGAFDPALRLFSELVLRCPDEPSYFLEWMTTAFLAKGKLPSIMKEQALAFVAHYPDAYEIVHLLALDAFLCGAYEHAITYWQQLLDNDLALTHPQKQIIGRALLVAKDRLVLTLPKEKEDEKAETIG